MLRRRGNIDIMIVRRRKKAEIAAKSLTAPMGVNHAEAAGRMRFQMSHPTPYF